MSTIPIKANTGPQPPYRKIIHVDMDAFFAAVEIRQNPALATQPIAVGFDGPRGVVSTANYLARRYGVHSAQSIAHAKQLCPSLVVVPCHFSLYREVSQQVHEIFHQFTDVIEPLSLDEAFLDVTANKKGISLAVDIAWQIKAEIKQSTGLTASAGVSYCKFLAKVASDFRKPDGLCVVHPLKAQEFIDSLPIEDFWGVGPKTAQRMHALGISNGLELRKQTLELLRAQFGKQGQIYYDFARGIDNRPVITERIRKSISCEETFETDIFSLIDIRHNLRALAFDLAERIKKKGFSGRTLTLKVKFQDFTLISRSASAPCPLTDKEQIYSLSESLITGIEASPNRRIRLLGIGVSNPSLSSPDNDSLFPTLFSSIEEN